MLEERPGARRNNGGLALGRLAAALALAVIGLSGSLGAAGQSAAQAGMKEQANSVALPAPSRDGGYALARALEERRSVREFSASPLRLPELSQLLWSAQGTTLPGHRSAPSAGALYPLEVYVAVGRVEPLAPGIYKYLTSGHRLALVGPGDKRAELARAAFGQSWLSEAAAILVLTAVERRTTAKYGRRGVRYVHMEAGHAAQNVLVEAVALGLGAAPVGAFDDDAVAAVLGVPPAEQPLYLIPLGRAR